MTRLLIASLLLVACSDDGIHNATPCSTAWPGATGSLCEAACTEPPSQTGGSCSASLPAGNFTCPSTFEFSGHQGCCVDRRQDPEDTIYFAECN